MTRRSQSPLKRVADALGFAGFGNTQSQSTVEASQAPSANFHKHGIFSVKPPLPGGKGKAPEINKDLSSTKSVPGGWEESQDPIPSIERDTQDPDPDEAFLESPPPARKPTHIPVPVKTKLLLKPGVDLVHLLSPVERGKQESVDYLISTTADEFRDNVAGNPDNYWILMRRMLAQAAAMKDHCKDLEGKAFATMGDPQELQELREDLEEARNELNLVESEAAANKKRYEEASGKLTLKEEYSHKLQDKITEKRQRILDLEEQARGREADIKTLRATIAAAKRGSTRGRDRTPAPELEAVDFQLDTPPRRSSVSEERRRRSPTRLTTATLKTAGTGRSLAAAHRVRVKDPEVFAGDRKKFPEWLCKLRAKLDSDQAYYEEAGQDKAVGYIQGLTTENAFLTLKPRLPEYNTTSSRYKSADEMIETLKKHYGDRDLYGKAQSEFSTLVMKDSGETFEEFYTRFQNCVLWMDKSDSQLIWDLKTKLNRRYRARLMDGTNYSSLGELVERLYTLQSQFTEYDGAFPKTQKTFGNKTKSTASTTNGSSARPVTTSVSAARPTRGAGQREPYPEEYKGLKKLDDAERARCDEAGLCYSCRRPGHQSWDDNCPLKQWRERNGGTTRPRANVASISNDPVELSEN